MAVLALAEAQQRRLRLARRAFGLGLQLAAGHPGDAARVGALVQFDFAVEAAVKTFLLALGHPDATIDMPRVLSAMTKHLDALSPPVQVDGVSAMAQLRKTRNAAQHEARVPTLEEVQDARAHAHLFFRSYFDAVWGLDFDQTDVDEIVDPKVRAALEHEAEAAARGDFSDAAGWTARALELAMEQATRRIIRPYPSGDPVMEPAIRGMSAPGSAGRDLTAALKATHRVASLVALGLIRPSSSGSTESCEGHPTATTAWDHSSALARERLLRTRLPLSAG